MSGLVDPREQTLQDNLSSRLDAIALPWRCIKALHVTKREYELASLIVEQRDGVKNGVIVCCGIPLKIREESTHAA